MSEAVDPNGGSVAHSRPRLGELLLQRGLLTPERLEEALAEQRATNLPLGTILVRDGLVPTHAIAMALADQVGAPLKTEHGFATGHGPRPSAPSLADVLPLRPPPTTEGVAEPAPTFEPPAPPPPAAVQLPPIQIPEPLPPPPSFDLPELSVDVQGHGAPALNEELVPEEPEDDRSELLEARFAALEARAAELEASLKSAHEDTAAERAASSELRDRIDELEELLDLVRAAATVEPPTGRVFSSERHVLLAANGERYELFERKGPAPEVGELVELSGHRMFRVLRVGPAPFPGAFEACAFLDPVREPEPEPDAAE